MYAVIETGGKQYKVQEGDILEIEKLEDDKDSKISFEKVLCVKSEGLKVGKPFLEGAKVEATVLDHYKGKKVIIYKYRAKKDFRKKQGHRQPITKVQIDKIVL